MPNKDKSSTEKSNAEKSNAEEVMQNSAPKSSPPTASPPPASKSPASQPASDQQLAARWEELRAAIRKQWPSLSADDLSLIDGDSRKLIALVHQKTGADVSDIESRIDAIAEGSNGLFDRVTRSIQAAGTQANDAVVEPLIQAYHSVEDQVSAYPARAFAMAFGAGMVIGFFTSSVLKDAYAPRRNSYFEGW